jgi:hypothetical protein
MAKCKQLCAYCGVKMRRGATEPGKEQAPTQRTRDHIMPLHRGGKQSAWVHACNQDKHHLTVNEWRIVLMWRRRRPVVFHFEKLIPSTLIGILTLKLSPWLRCLA